MKKNRNVKILLKEKFSVNELWRTWNRPRWKWLFFFFALLVIFKFTRSIVGNCFEKISNYATVPDNFHQHKTFLSLITLQTKTSRRFSFFTSPQKDKRGLLPLFKHHGVHLGSFLLWYSPVSPPASVNLTDKLNK